MCPPLTAPDNGAITCSLGDDEEANYNVGETCTFTCDDGYELTGSVNRSCQIDRSWSGYETTCTLSTSLCSYIITQLGFYLCKDIAGILVIQT